MQGRTPSTTATIPEVTLRRLPVYYRTLQGLKASGATRVSSADLARILGLDPTQVRKDIEMTGIVGKPRVGYSLADLEANIKEFLGWTRPKEAILVGVGSLGSAMLGYGRFRDHGMHITSVFDVDPKKIGRKVQGRKVLPLDRLAEAVLQSGAVMGLIATPASEAQDVANRMVQAGIRAIWNFAPAHLQVPPHIILQNEDLYYSLASLSFKLDCSLGITRLEKRNQLCRRTSM